MQILKFCIPRFAFLFFPLPKYYIDMLEAISPVNPKWIHEHVFEPPLEGIERINLAWAGKNIHSLNQTLLTLKERVVFFLVGVALIIPLIGKIIWMAWQTFGKPQRLSDPFIPELESPPLTPPVRPIQAQPVINNAAGAAALPVAVGAVAAPPQAGIKPPQIFAYKETGPRNEMSPQHDEIQANWRLEFLSEHNLKAQQFCDNHSSTASYSDWAITEFIHESHIQKPGGIEYFKVTKSDAQTLQVELKVDGEVTHKQLKLQENLPWIQQPTIGFKNFICSDKQSLRFYGVLPKNTFRKINPFAAKPPLAMTFTATKVGEEISPVHGNLIKINVVSDWGVPYNIYAVELWLHKETGELRKFINPFESKSGEYIQNHPLPAPAHP
jgi:hypothetical protein